VKTGIYLLFLSIFLVSTAGRFVSTDEVAVFLTTKSLVERQELAIKKVLNTVQGTDGRYYSQYGLGQSILAIPLFLIGDAVDRHASAGLVSYFSGPRKSDWRGSAAIFFVSLLNELVTPLTCLLVFLFGLRLGFEPRVALAVTCLLGLATLTWTYAASFFQHPLETLLLLASVYTVLANRERWRARHAAVAGMCFAFGVFVRVSLLLLLPALLAYVVVVAARRRLDQSAGGGPTWPRQVIAALLHPGALRSAAAFSLPVIAVLGADLALNAARFGTPWLLHAGAQEEGFSNPLVYGLYGYLVTPGRSVLIYSPPLVMAVLGFRQFAREQRELALLSGAIFSVYLVVYSKFTSWDGGWSFGPRYLVATLPLLLLPVGYALATRAGRLLAGALGVAGVAVQILGLSVNVSAVYWSWRLTRLSPDDAYLYVPAISAIPTHLRALLAGRDVDLWLVWVWRRFGAGCFLVTLLVPLALLALALVLLSNRWWRLRPAR
jgi:hypothetical protein